MTVKACAKLLLGIKSDWTALRHVSDRAPYLVPCCFLCTSMFSLHIIDIMSDIESKTRLFADDCFCYSEIKYMEVTLKLQKMQHVAADKKA